jgi:hypothetical protein
MPLDSAAFSEIVTIYQEEIASLINNLGKPVILYYESTITNVSESMDDKLRRELKKPTYKDAVQPTISETTETITALLKFDPKDFEDFGSKVNNPQGILRLKTFLYDVPKLIRCKYIVPAQSRGVIDAKYKLLREPIPVGLRDDKFAVSFWERI